MYFGTAWGTIAARSTRKSTRYPEVAQRADNYSKSDPKGARVGPISQSPLLRMETIFYLSRIT